MPYFSNMHILTKQYEVFVYLYIIYVGPNGQATTYHSLVPRVQAELNCNDLTAASSLMMVRNGNYTQMTSEFL